MKIAFYILTFLVCGVAAYFSLSHMEKFESQRDTRIETIKTNRSVSATADATEAEIVVRSGVLRQAEEERATATASLESATATGRSLTGQVNELDSSIQGQQAEISRLNGTISEITAKLSEFGANATPDTIPETISTLERQRDELIAEKNELLELIGAAERNLDDKQAEAAAVAQRTATRNSQLSLNATEAVISAVNHDWGFVLIGAGSNSGFSPQSSMVVQRDGRVIGRVRPSSVEPTQTVAEIEYSTLSPGVRLQPGDRVLLARPVAN
jgi:small-conductance mechanosensitive channel